MRILSIHPNRISLWSCSMQRSNSSTNVYWRGKKNNFLFIKSKLLSLLHKCGRSALIFICVATPKLVRIGRANSTVHNISVTFFVALGEWTELGSVLCVGVCLCVSHKERVLQRVHYVLLTAAMCLRSIYYSFAMVIRAHFIFIYFISFLFLVITLRVLLNTVNVREMKAVSTGLCMLR